MSSPVFTDEDRAFVRGILTNPADQTGWLAYADWLDERNDPRAEFLRLSVRRDRPENEAELPVIDSRLAKLRPTLDPDWLAVFDRPAIENCSDLFEFACPKRWENLKATERSDVRHCEACEKPVYYSRSIEVARRHARVGRCVAVSLSVRRRPGDLERVEHTTMGIILPSREPVPPQPPEPPARPWWKIW